jgi:hypothetical protein
MKAQTKKVSMCLSLLTGVILFVTGCKSSPGTIEVAALQPVPLIYTAETSKEALEKLKAAKIDPNAISQSYALQQIIARELSAKLKATSDSAPPPTSTTPTNTSSCQTLSQKDLTAFGKLLDSKPVLNSRYAISNLADLYEWRIANEILFKLQDIFGDEYTLYYVPAIISISPGSDSFKDFYAKITFNVSLVEETPNPDENIKQKNKDRIHLLALCPLRQFDNRSESLSKRTQFMLSLMTAAMTKAGPVNLNLDAYYNMLNRLEKDFSQIRKVPVVTSFVSNGRYTFGWNIYPQPQAAGTWIENRMTPDTWRFGAIIAVKKSGLKGMIIKPTYQWIRLPETWTWFTTDKIECENDKDEAISLDFPKVKPKLLYAIPEHGCLIKLCGIDLDKIKKLTLTQVGDNKKEIKVRKLSSSPTQTWCLLEDGTLTDKATYLLEAVFSKTNSDSIEFEYNTPKP